MIISLPVCVCAGTMDVEGIIQCIKRGDENGVETQLQEFNKEVTPHRNSHILMSGQHTAAEHFCHRCSLHSMPSASSLMHRRGSKGK